VWAEQNGPGLWISTYTRNLQRQILQEIAKLYPDPKRREEMAVLRKGRENCLACSISKKRPSVWRLRPASAPWRSD
jgi:Rad3-related DNA helicase